MSIEEATRWADGNGFFIYSFKFEDRTLWDLSGWGWRKNRKDKERIHLMGPDLVAMAQRAKNRFEELRDL